METMISCPLCGAIYLVAKASLSNTMDCRECGASFLMGSSRPVPSKEPAPNPFADLEEAEPDIQLSDRQPRKRALRDKELDSHLSREGYRDTETRKPTESPTGTAAFLIGLAMFIILLLSAGIIYLAVGV